MKFILKFAAIIILLPALVLIYVLLLIEERELRGK